MEKPYYSLVLEQLSAQKVIKENTHYQALGFEMPFPIIF